MYPPLRSPPHLQYVATHLVKFENRKMLPKF